MAATGLMAHFFAASCIPLVSLQCRNRQGFIDSPSSFQALLNKALIRTDFARPLCNGLCFAAKCHPMIIAAIIALSLQVSPSTVVGAIWPVIINAVNRQTVWTDTHISEECREVRAPAITHRDAASAIGWIRTTVRIVATPFDFAPSVVSARMLMSVFSAMNLRDFDSEAAATIRTAAQKGRAGNNAFSPTYASTQPMMQAVARHTRQHGPSTERNAGEIDVARHDHLFYQRFGWL